MNTALILAATMLGAGSGGHCMLMCGATSSWCAGHEAGSGAWRRLLAFQLGRVIGYACVGAILASAASGLQIMSAWVGALRPLWTMANVGLFLVGLYLLATAKQPLWLTSFGERFGRRVRAWLNPPVHALSLHRAGVAPPEQQPPRSVRSLLVGASWAMLPCGPLYSAWALALFAGSAAGGAITAAAFAIASGAQLLFAQWLLMRRQRGVPAEGARKGFWGGAGVRLAGAVLCMSAVWSIATLMFPTHAAEWLCL